MEHQFKFRAWDGKEMRQPGPNMFIDSFGGNTFWQFAYDPPSPTFWEVMQYTGLKDRNGVEIYEGDILEERKGSFFSVVWDEKWAKFKLQHPPKSIQYPEWNRGVQMAVVGNIFENPELMEPTP